VYQDLIRKNSIASLDSILKITPAVNTTPAGCECKSRFESWKGGFEPKVLVDLNNAIFEFLDLYSIRINLPTSELYELDNTSANKT